MRISSLHYSNYISKKLKNKNKKTTMRIKKTQISYKLKIRIMTTLMSWIKMMKMNQLVNKMKNKAIKMKNSEKE